MMYVCNQKENVDFKNAFYLFIYFWKNHKSFKNKKPDSGVRNVLYLLESYPLFNLSTIIYDFIYQISEDGDHNF